MELPGNIAYDSVHVEVEIVELNAIGVGLAHIHRDFSLLAILVFDDIFLLLFNRIN